MYQLQQPKQKIMKAFKFRNTEKVWPNGIHYLAEFDFGIEGALEKLNSLGLCKANDQLRADLNEKIKMAIEGHKEFSPYTAVRICKRLHNLEPHWGELSRLARFIEAELYELFEDTIAKESEEAFHDWFFRGQ